MRAIYKYHLNLGKCETIVGRFVQFLDAQIQNDNLVIWAIADTEFPELEVEVASICTGGTTKEHWKYFRTIQYNNLGYHIFFTQENYRLSDNFETSHVNTTPIFDLFFGGKNHNGI